MADHSVYRSKYTSEVRNLAMANPAETDISPQLDYTVEGPFWELLAEHRISLAVSREYEHFIALLGAEGGRPRISSLALPHPSGLFYDTASGELIVSSTRTPNQIFWMRPVGPTDYASDVVPQDFEPVDGVVYLPYRSILLPGTLYIHDLALIGRELYATVTGHNFLARLRPEGGWERVWWPELLDGMGRAAFDQNYLQLNSIAVGDDPESSYYTAFSDQTTGPKPWKEGYGPKGRGVVFDGASRAPIVRGLTCPHSARLRSGRLWLCNSGYGELGYVEPGDGSGAYTPVAQLPGFTRGLAFHGKYAFVGLSHVIPFYEPYAPGLDPAKTVCGVAVVDLQTGEKVAQLTWPQGYQIYDVQVMPDVTAPVLPDKPTGAGNEINRLLRYLG